MLGWKIPSFAMIRTSTEDLCDPNAPAGESGCGFSSLVPGLKCSGKEFCADGNGGVCVPSSNEAGVICGDVNPANCLGGNACEKSACNPLTGQCEASLNFELGESASCDAQDPESGHFCGDGSCQPCPPGDPDCDVAHCVPSSPFGFQCTTDWDCASLDGNTWKCVGPVGDKHCILPCAGPPCQECMEKGNAVELRASVFKSCGQVCAGNQVFADSPSEMLQPDFLNAFWTSEDVGFLVADPDQAIAAIANAIDGLTLLKDVPMPEQPVGALFAEDMYSCSEKCALENAPLCYCDENVCQEWGLLSRRLP